MKFGLVSTVSVEVQHHAKVVTEISQQIKDFLEKRDYGTDVQELYVGVTCVSPEFEKFFKSRSPKYSQGFVSYVKDDVKYETNNCFEYAIELNFDQIRKAGPEEVRETIIAKFIPSLHYLDRFKDFRADEFRTDVKNFLESQ